MNNQEQSLIDLEIYWCERMSILVEKCQIGDADALFSEYVIDDVEGFDTKDWVFAPYHKEIK